MAWYLVKYRVNFAFTGEMWTCDDRDNTKKRQKRKLLMSLTEYARLEGGGK
jgi:hypothetical protein